MALDPVIHYALTGFFAAILGLAARHKLRDLKAFEQALRAYDLLPRSLVPLAARLLPLIEAGLAIGLVVRATSGGFLAADLFVVATVLLMLAYGAAMGLTLAQGRRDIRCACGGLSGEQTISRTLVGRNLVLALLAGCLLSAPAARSLLWLDGATVGFATLFLLLTYMSADLAAQTGAMMKDKDL